MSLTGLLSETVTVIRPGETIDEYGDVVPGGETRVDYPGRLEQLSTDELLRDRDTIVADWRVFLPPDADIAATDWVEGRGHVFHVNGLPMEHRTPRGPHHIEALLKVAM